MPKPKPSETPAGRSPARRSRRSRPVVRPGTGRPGSIHRARHKASSRPRRSAPGCPCSPGTARRPGRSGPGARSRTPARCWSRSPSPPAAPCPRRSRRRCPPTAGRAQQRPGSRAEHRADGGAADRRLVRGFRRGDADLVERVVPAVRFLLLELREVLALGRDREDGRAGGRAHGAAGEEETAEQGSQGGSVHGFSGLSGGAGGPPPGVLLGYRPFHMGRARAFQRPGGTDPGGSQEDERRATRGVRPSRVRESAP